MEGEIKLGHLTKNSTNNCSFFFFFFFFFFFDSLIVSKIKLLSD